MMNITYLGHAGFFVETNSSIILMDPWLSPNGAFDSSWFQYPQNHHMAAKVQEIFKQSNKDKYIYISHEHKDHFDLAFLESIEDRDFKIILADFARPVVKESLVKNNFKCKDIISLKDNEELTLKDGKLVIFLIDMELDCDSAILIKTDTHCFLNLNDSKIHERLAAINEQYGPINGFAAQFSGAVWHPTCYVMDEEKYEIISHNKNLRKFKAITKAIEILEPDIYFPSAGPPCFLDPRLIGINFEKVNTYPRAPHIIEYLNSHFANNKEIKTCWPELMPGDIYDLAKHKFSYLTDIRVKDKNFVAYVKNYAQQYEDFFESREKQNAKIKPESVFVDLKNELEKKITNFRLVKKNLPTPLYFALDELPHTIYCIDFEKSRIEIKSKIEHKEYYFISTPAWQVNKVLQGEISWPDFALTFRVKLKREPDIYSTLMHGFLTLDVESLERFCQLFFDIFSKRERINIDYKGKTYSVLRYCPHQGGDLLHAWVEDCFLVCPRHQWKFDLENGGKCRYNDASIDAICLHSKDENKDK